METNGIETVAQLMREENGFDIEGIDQSNGHGESADYSSFGPLVNRIAFGIAREIAVAIKELEHHVETEVRKSGEAGERRLNSFQSELAEMSHLMEEHRSFGGALRDQLQRLDAADAELRDAQGRQTAEMETVRTEVRESSGAVSARLDAITATLHEANSRQASEREALLNESRASLQPVWDRIEDLCRQIDAQQGDIATTKETLNSICSRIDGFVGRLDRQAEAVRSLHGACGQRDAELDQIVEGLARLRSTPRPALADEL